MPRSFLLDASWSREQWSAACAAIERDEAISFATPPIPGLVHGSQPLREDPPHVLADFMAWLWGDDAE